MTSVLWFIGGIAVGVNVGLLHAWLTLRSANRKARGIRSRIWAWKMRRRRRRIVADMPIDISASVRQFYDSTDKPLASRRADQ